MHAEDLPWSICVPSLQLIAQAVFLYSAAKETDKRTKSHTQLMSQRTPQPRPVCVGNDQGRRQVKQSGVDVSLHPSPPVATPLVMSETSTGCCIQCDRQLQLLYRAAVARCAG